MREGENETLRSVVREREREVRVKGENGTLRGAVGEREIENLQGEVRVKERDNETLRGVVQERVRERAVGVKSEENQSLRRLLQEKDLTIHQTQQFAPSSCRPVPLTRQM